MGIGSQRPLRGVRARDRLWHQGAEPFDAESLPLNARLADLPDFSSYAILPVVGVVLEVAF